MFTMCVYVGEHTTASLEVRGHLCGVAFFFTWLLQVELRLPNLSGKCFFLLILLPVLKIIINCSLYYFV